MRGFFDPGDLPGDHTLHWPDNNDIATRKDPYDGMLEILSNCRHVGASGWYQFGMFPSVYNTLSTLHELWNIEYRAELES